MTKEPKKMNYSIEPIRKILLDEAISDGGTQQKAAAIDGTWIRANENEFFLVEKEQTTRVYYGDGKCGCACDRFKDSSNLLCEHIIAFDDLNTMPQLSIQSPDCRWLSGYLMSAGEWTSRDGYLYPPESETKELDPVNEDKPLDIGVEEEPVIDEKTWSRKCQYCEAVISGTDLDQVKKDIAEHTRGCPKNPANKNKSPKQVTQEAPKQEPIVKDSPTPEKPTVAKSAPVRKPPSKKTGSLFDWIENLVEFGVGQLFGDTGTAKTAFCRELAEQAADEGKKVVYWDTEGNMTRKQRAAMAEHTNISYILDRDWVHIKNMLSSDLSKGSPKLSKCDMFIFDSIGVPVLGIYGTLKQNKKGEALQAMQGLLYELTKFAETNEAVVIVTNQPVSEMNKTPEQIADRHPFGDKAMFFTKEILRIGVAERTEYKTVCHIRAWRSRSAGRGKLLCTVTVSDNGIEVTPAGGD